jgi:hypothetical protein
MLPSWKSTEFSNLELTATKFEEKERNEEKIKQQAKARKML